MRKFLAAAVLIMFPFVAQAQQAPSVQAPSLQAPALQAPSIQMPSMSEMSPTATAAAVVIGAAVGAVVLPVAITGLAATSATIAGYGTAAWESGVTAIHAYPFLSGMGAALGAWIGYSM
ncbi:MAG: hypothetical protein AB7O45_09805 [Alphaproteobacteria bacterium]